MSLMMHCIAGFGLWVVWSPPFVKGGADFNMTAWWLVLHGVIDAGHKLPPKLKFLSDRRDGNWSVSQLGWDVLLCALEITEEVERRAMPPEHGHGKADAEGGKNMHYRHGNCRKDSCSGAVTPALFRSATGLARCGEPRGGGGRCFL
jgi:hypothetical protein